MMVVHNVTVNNLRETIKGIEKIALNCMFLLYI